LIEIPAVPVGTKFSRWRPPNNRGPKEKFLKKVQSFSDTLYVSTSLKVSYNEKFFRQNLYRENTHFVLKNFSTKFVPFMG
jgi:hypothetical protein